MPKNFQNWIGMNSAADPSSASGIPGTEFQDWSNLNGPSDYMKMASGAEGVAPPANWSEYAQQAVAPIQQKFNNLSTAASQLSQGNTFNAYQAYKGKSTPTALTKPDVTNESTNGGYDFSR